MNKGELVKEIEIPACDDYVVSYRKLRLRDAIDFAIISLATAYKLENGKIVDARVVLGGVAPVPYRLRKVEAFIKGKPVDEALATEAGTMACSNAVCLNENSYKLQEIKVYIKNSLLSLT